MCKARAPYRMTLPNRDCIRIGSTQDQNSALLQGDSVPLEEKYESWDALSYAINVWVTTRGYVLITGRPTKDEADRQTITFMYDRRRNYPIALQGRKRKANTRTISCELPASRQRVPR